MPVLSEGTIERPDGRLVEWAEWGDPAGKPILRLHGTPGSRLTRPFTPDLYERLGAHVVTLDRPGYGRSTPQRERTWLSCADDAVAVADAMGWDTFGVTGQSGGAPHALAIGVRAPQRVRVLGLTVPSAPPELIDLDDMDELNAESMRRGREGRESLEAFMAPSVETITADILGGFDGLIGSGVDPQGDRARFQEPELRAIFFESVSEALANGPQGWYDDGLYLSIPWDFALEDVAVPVHIWYSADDTNAPPRSVELMAARLNVAAIERRPGGHFGDAAHEEQIWRTLIAAA
jgi:pimeloyl-ACP methyl ester carboxylesterase